ncbi:DUF1800 domain-containing protein [Granulicella tundricola]|uniref:DUF1800 domain-containing protein n=1 Tax=Granulicella tundricola (strain ATCC BAA-1859 / DSM 23138 / MP5ACTX9) TaxID=1198114 RepID=E8WXK5_GRATM|nr:DUF1800 domain-containing protein [Granulicella tundricola]ADW68621.1 protein of unknown function DUF1800 [Granulicella tundricola MP5ACTX9]
MTVDLKALGRMTLAVSLCGLLAGEPLVAAVPAGTELRGDARVLHALNRFTFGPRPGDVTAVKAMGLKRWFDLQLEPGKIDDSALDARLAQFPAMGLSVGELMSRYPGPQAIRAMEAGRRALPSDPTARVIATDEVAFYKMQKAQKAGKETLKQAAAEPVDADGMMAAGQLAPGQTAGDKPLAANEVSAAEPMMDGPVAGGMSHEAVMAIVNQPPAQRYDSLLALPAGDLVSLRRGMKPRELLQLVDGLTPVQKETLQALPGAVRMVALESMESRLERDIYSDRQLEAVMTDFWLNHFNVYLRKNQQEPYLIPTYERETIRPHALGSFEDLLVATAKSPAMLMYLDNWRSTGPDSQAAARIKRIQQMRPNGPIAKNASAGLNENYGRELMELHTLGVGGGYSQADVTQVAKVFTGWTIDKPYGQAEDGAGGFVFDGRRHEPGAKVVMGQTIKEGGEKEGLEVLHMLATSPATARFISTKLAVRFVSDAPPQALIDRMTTSFLASHGDIKTVLRTMFDAPEFWAPDVERAKVKTPLEFVVSAVRAGGVEVNNAQPLVKALDKLGMPLYGMQTPNGYSWMKDGWVSTGALVSRMNFALVLTDDRMPGARTEWGRLLGGVQNVSYEADAKERRLEGILLGFAVSEKTRAAVLSQSKDGGIADQAAAQFDLSGGGKKGAGKGLRVMAGGGSPDDAQAAVMAGLLLGSPEFQRR